MRAPDNFTFISLVLLTLCTTKPMPAGTSSTETTVASRRAPVRGAVRVHDRVLERTSDVRVVGRHPS